MVELGADADDIANGMSRDLGGELKSRECHENHSGVDDDVSLHQRDGDDARQERKHHQNHERGQTDHDGWAQIPQVRLPGD